MKKVFFAVICLFGTACGKESAPAQYNYKTIEVTSIYTNWKKDKNTAMEKAESELDRFTKSTCRETIANGWSLFEIKNQGEMSCEETSEGHHCRIKNLKLKCREIIAGFGS